MILVTGATGNVGGEVVTALVAAGEEVRALIRRDADRSRLAGGVEGFVGDLSRAETLGAALEGVRGLHLLAGYDDAFFSFFADGKLDESQVLPTVQEVTGRPPRTFEQWALAHAEAFR